MPLTHAEILARIRNVLSDSGTTYGSDTIVGEYMGAILKNISHQVPFNTSEKHPTDSPAPTRGSYTTDGTTRDIILTDWDYDDLVRISQVDGVEYEVDQSPKEYRNFTLQQRVLTLWLDDIPDASETVYVYPQRLHILQSAIGTTTLTGKIKTLAAIAATSLALKTLGTGTINQYTKLTIAGDTTEYMVKAAATIAANEATATITPGLVAAAAVDAVVTLALADSTLTPALEEPFIKWVSGELLRRYGLGKMETIAKSATWRHYIDEGEQMIAEAKAVLRGLQIAGTFVRHPTS